MERALQIAFKNMSSSEFLEGFVRDRVDRLERFHPNITGARVVIEVPHRSAEGGKMPIGISVEVDIPGHNTIVAKGEQDKREITWPTVEIFEAGAPRAPRDLVLVRGTEPSMHWRTFCENLIDLAEALGVQVVVTLGALLGDVPHTRPVSMTGHASDPSMLERLELHA